MTIEFSFVLSLMSAIYIDNNSTLTRHKIYIRRRLSWKMRGFPEHFPRFVLNTYIKSYVKSMHRYCPYTAIISDIIGLNTVFLEIIYLQTLAAHPQTEYVKFVSELPEFIHT